MKFIEHLLQEGLQKKQLRPIKGLTPREAEIMMNLMAKALIAEYADSWKFNRDDLDNPEDLISDGIMQDADSIVDINYGTLYRAVEDGVKRFK